MSQEQQTPEPSTYHALLAEYAAGTLTAGQSVLVSAHLELNKSARRFVSICEQLGGVLIENYCDPEEMSEQSLNAVLERLEKREEVGPPNKTAAHKNILPEDLCAIPACIENTLCQSLTPQQLQWKKMLPGIQVFKLPLPCAQTTLNVFKISPAKTFPEHKHSGLEVTLVLEGAITDEGKTYTAGDLMIHDASTAHHAPQSCETNGCVCIVGYVSPVRFTRFPMNLLNPFLR